MMVPTRYGSRMDGSRLTAQLLPFVWVIWTAATGVLAARTLRDDVWPHAERRRGLWLVLGVSVSAVVATFFLPSRIDASGLMELSGGKEPWKGASGEALLGLIRAVVPLSHEDIIHLTRAWLVPTCALAMAASRGQIQGPALGTIAGVDVRRVAMVGVLLATPSFLFGVLGVFNFWFFCSLVLAMLLAWDDLTRSPAWASRISLLSSVALLGFARPETIVGGIVMAALVALFAWRRKDPKLLVPALVLLVALCSVAPTIVAYLGERMRNQPLLTGADATGDASIWMLPWIALRRIVQHAPLNLLVLLVAFHAMGVLAVGRAWRMIRERRASWPEVAAMALLLTEFAAIGVHREGFSRYIKYGQLLVVPSWFLAASVLGALPPTGKARVWLPASVAAGLVVTLASVLISWLGYTRCSRPEGQTFAARSRDETLLWNTAPRWAESVCAPDRGQGPVRVVVVGFDERAQTPGRDDEDMFGKPHCEPERWPIVHLLHGSGCWAAAAYPAADRSVEEVLFDPSHGVLCSGVPFDELAQEPQRATHAIASYYAPARRNEIREAVERSATCAWEIQEITDSAVLLRRREVGR